MFWKPFRPPLLRKPTDSVRSSATDDFPEPSAKKRRLTVSVDLESIESLPQTPTDQTTDALRKDSHLSSYKSLYREPLLNALNNSELTVESGRGTDHDRAYYNVVW